MLDRRTAILLQRINELCADGGYKILETEELLSAFSPELAQSEEGLDGMLSHLKENEYISLKYADTVRGVYCLSPLPSGRLYAEKVLQKRMEKVKNFQKTLLVNFLGSFLGALLGAGMVALFTAFWG